MTPRSLILKALKKAGVIGVGQSANPEDIQDAFDDLNDMFGQWQRRRWLVTDLVEIVFSSNGKQSYSIGPGVKNDIIMSRPDQLADAFVRLSPDRGMPIDYKLTVLSSREDYNEIALKQQVGITSVVYYDPALPNGRLFVWPTPPGDGSTEFHLFFKSQEFLALGFDDNINLPTEYNEAMTYNLSARLRVSYQLPPDGAVVALANAALATIRKANVQIPEMNMPGDLPGQMSRGGMGSLGYGGGGGTGGSGIFRLDISLLDGTDVLEGGSGSAIIPGTLMGIPSAYAGATAGLPADYTPGSSGSAGSSNFRVDVSALDGLDVLL